MHLPVAAALAATLLVPMGAVAWAQDTRGGGDDRGLEAALARAVTAGRDLAHAGRLTSVSFRERGPQVTSVDLTRGDGGLLVEPKLEAGWRLGWVGGEGFLLSADSLVRVGGVERVPVQLDRLHAKYAVGWGPTSRIDTGRARALELTEHATGVLREVLYLDDATGLVVRRETFDTDGRPVRVVAYTELAPATADIVLPASDGLEVRDHRQTVRDAADLLRRGFAVPDTLPNGYELLAAVSMSTTSVPTAHLVYSDGLYTISVFEQQGRMARAAVRGGAELTTPDGGTVWRWPGSEPRRVVWSGDGSTYTVLTDAPTDELLSAIVGLPTDPGPSTLARLERGLRRVGSWFWPDWLGDDRSET